MKNNYIKFSELAVSLTKHAVLETLCSSSEQKKSLKIYRAQAPFFSPILHEDRCGSLVLLLFLYVLARLGATVSAITCWNRKDINSPRKEKYEIKRKGFVHVLWVLGRCCNMLFLASILRALRKENATALFLVPRRQASELLEVIKGE